MEGTPLAQLLHEFHQHRLGATIEDVTYAPAEQSFFDDVVSGVDARREEIDGVIAAALRRLVAGTAGQANAADPARWHL
jgi:N utilization substance protein B